MFGTLMNHSTMFLAAAALGWSSNSLSAGKLEIPAGDHPYGDLSVETGIGLISGWHCTAKRIEIVIDDMPPIAAPYSAPTAALTAAYAKSGAMLLSSAVLPMYATPKISVTTLPLTAAPTFIPRTAPCT